MPDTTEIQEGLQIGDGAVARIKLLIENENNPAMKLRIGITGGGCSGFQYNFSLDDKVNDDDVLFERDGIAVVVDETSIPFVSGTVLDFKNDLMGNYFTMDNPNASSTCGCGSSFSV
ncbi:iron-sulfur cluster insertion protein ErpA [Magnetovibrio sp. PR-2]|uniref:iron-sulfur cluster insertion protein ErpA n=1 Tax=Magnetovibrio sp. PR-2 TaxID=3120356 RepID=UPI002FCDE350